MKQCFVRMTRRKFAVTAVALMSAMVALSSCAPMPNTATAPDRAAQLSGYSGGNTGTSSSWVCPSYDNVKLYGNVNGSSYDYTGTQSFRVCKPSVTTDSSGAKLNASFKIMGSTTWNFLCVFPAFSGYNSSGPTFQLSDQPQCFGVNGSAIEVKFNTPNVNYLMIVHYDYYQQMVSCLSGSAPCPTRAEGFVQ